jgi:hypothetical protein
MKNPAKVALSTPTNKAFVGDPALRDAHLSDDKAVAKMGHPALTWEGVRV